MNNRRFLTIALAIVLVAMLLRLWNFYNTIGSDDQRYIIAARELGSTHTPEIRAVYYSRIVWRAVLGAWGGIWGLSLQSSAWLMFGLSCTSILLVALAGRAAFGPRAGLWAAAIYASHPITMVYDVMTHPGVLAVALLSAYLFLFLKYLKNERLDCLALCGLLVGVSFSTKEYYVLAALPFSASLLIKAGSVRRALNPLCVFLALVVVGFSTDVLLHFWESGNLLGHFTGLSEYGERRAGRTNPHTGFQLVARTAYARLEYFYWMFMEMGPLSGFLSFWGLMTLALKSRKSLACFTLLGLIGIFFLFLFLAPSSFRPLRFVETQPRYLIILLPMLSVGAGLSLASALSSMPATTIRHALVVALCIGLISNGQVPNDLHDHTIRRFYTAEFTGIKQVLTDAKNQGVQEVVFPTKFYWQTIPDGYYNLGVAITYCEVNDKESADALADYIKQNSTSIVFVPRSPFLDPLVVRLREGTYAEEVERSRAGNLLDGALEERGLSLRKVQVPDTVLKSWLAWAGLVKREQQLVGWVYGHAQVSRVGDASGK